MYSSAAIECTRNDPKDTSLTLPPKKRDKPKVVRTFEDLVNEETVKVDAEELRETAKEVAYERKDAEKKKLRNRYFIKYAYSLTGYHETIMSHLCYRRG